ncbi:MAG: tetratricopeptide repeat protein [Deltaproteobacteria bacterium]|nr:tetratricopeptide repeat protein [Deltaproteobacteria bacterium]
MRPKLPPLTTTGKSTANTDEVPPWVKRTGDWLADRRSTVFGVVAAIVLAGVGGTYAMDRRIEKRAEQAAKTVQAAEISNAEVRGADAPADPPNAPPRRIRAYASHTERARAALAASEQAIGTGDMQISPVSKLMRAQALYDLGRYAEAKTILEPLVGADVMGLEGRVLETLGFCQEALGDNRSALARFEELGRLEGDGWRDLAGYHQARVLRRMNENDRARDGLRRLIERLDRARPDDLAAVQSRSVQEQAKLLLHEIAPDDPLGRTQAPTDTDSILRMLQQQMGGQMQVRRPGQPAQP